mmetsp:Transcript_48971/g.129455  ORF Transcript_48971/g.129455 Transcript_48971/m.129455 type:complete len:415 (+) Transcript_48971:887-2131(+)
MDVVAQIEALQGEGDDRGVLLDEEVVVAEPLHDEADVGRDAAQAVPSNLARLSSLRDGLEGLLPVELLQQVEEGHLRDEVQVVLEQRLVRQLQSQEHGLLLGLDDPCLVVGRAHLHLHLALEDVVDHGAAVLRLELPVKVGHEPAEEGDGVLLLGVELLGRGPADGLVELVRGHQPLEVPRVVHLPDKVGEGGQYRVLLLLRGRLVGEEHAAEGDHLADELDDDILVVRVADVVQADAARDVIRAVQGLGVTHPQGHLLNVLLVVGRGQVVLDVLERLIDDLVRVGDAKHLAVNDVHPHVVTLFQGVAIRVGLLAAALEVLAVHEVDVDVLAGEGYGAELLEVKIEDVPVDRTEVGAIDTLGHLCLPRRLCPDGRVQVHVEVRDRPRPLRLRLPSLRHCTRGAQALRRRLACPG